MAGGRVGSKMSTSRLGGGGQGYKHQDLVALVTNLNK